MKHAWCISTLRAFDELVLVELELDDREDSSTDRERWLQEAKDTTIKLRVKSKEQGEFYLACLAMNTAPNSLGRIPQAIFTPSTARAVQRAIVKGGHNPIENLNDQDRALISGPPDDD